MFGGVSALLFPLAIWMGIAAAASVHYTAMPPSFGWFVAILCLSIFDSAVGYTAGLVFAGAVLLGGGIVDATSVRELSGIVLAWFAVPLAAGAIRPLRRHVHLRPASLWDRTADWILAGAFAGWVTGEMVELLDPLGGFENPLAAQHNTIALIAFTVVG